ncbi:MAG: hypothetical protein H7Y59_15810 [Anaerolineales bacterium]|nr:hypothetical protein [Anaerolineales bacterium]
MNYLIITLRIIHILAGIIWVGGTLIMTFFIAPTIRATAEAGQKFIGHLMNNLKFSNWIAAAAGLSILAGLALFWIDSNGFTSAWMDSGAGIGFRRGAELATIGFVFGLLIGRTTKAMAKLGAQFQGPPSPEQMAQMQKLGRQQKIYSMIASLTLILAVIYMSIARYLVL